MTLKSELEKAFEIQDIPAIETLLNKYLKEYCNDYDRFSFLCNYNLLTGNNYEALNYAKEAVILNPHCIEANFNLAYVYDIIKDYAHAYLYYLIVKTLQDMRKITCIPDDSISERINYIKNISLNDTALSEAVLYADNYIQYSANDPFHIITELIGFPIMMDKNIYISGRYNDLMNQFFINTAPKDIYRCKAEVLKTSGNLSTSLTIDEKESCILPLFVTSENEQTFNFKCGNSQEFSYPARAKNSWYYFKIDEKTTVTSDTPFAYAEPIKLTHNPKNKKLVLNIFIDSFNFRIFELFSNINNSVDGFKKLMPNTYNFFSKGIICTNAYSDSEWTTPSFSSYWTGRCSDKTMNLNTDIWFPFNENTKLLAEYFEEKGYFTACINSNDSCTPSKGYMRGMKRELYKARGYNKEELVTDTLEQLRAFKNCDQFVTVEFEDLHDIAGGFPRGLSIQTTTDLKDLKSDNYICSTIKQTRSLNKQKIYINELQQLDFYLGFLFEYIEKNYNDDEYVVSLFSDHGTAFMVDDTELTICKQRMNVPFMFRDNMHKEITDEIVQNIDYPAILCNICGIDYNYYGTDANLPHFLGGNERKYAFSQTIFPGDCYQSAIMTKNYTYYFLSKEKVTDEFRIDISDASYGIVYDNKKPDENPDLNILTDIVLQHIKNLIIRR